MTKSTTTLNLADLQSTKVITCNHKTGEMKAYDKTTLLANRKQLIDIAGVIQDFEEGEITVKEYLNVLRKLYLAFDLTDLGLTGETND